MGKLGRCLQSTRRIIASILRERIKCQIWISSLVGTVVILYLLVSKIRCWKIDIDLRTIFGLNVSRTVSELDYILWPNISSIYSCPYNYSHEKSYCMSLPLLSRIEPLPRALSPKVKPSCDVIIRTSHGYSLFVNILLHSLKVFWPRDLGKIIVILDESEENRSYAATLPDYVTIFFEQLPPFTELWVERPPVKQLGSSIRTHGYGRAQWSNFISDRYSSADFIAIFDSDQIITGGGQLQLLFVWDIKLQKYKPIFVCFDNVDLWNSFAYNYEIFGMSKNIGVGCMKSLPVVMYRDTFPKIRKYLIKHFLVHEPSIYNHSRLVNVAPDYDRDYNWTWSTKTKSDNYSLPFSPTYFDRAFARIHEKCKLCQFCIFGAFIYTHPEESSRYAFKIIGYGKSAEKLKKDQIQLIKRARTVDNYRLTNAEIQTNHTNAYQIYSPECTQIHSGAHIAYMINGPKMSEEYFKIAEKIIDDGLCKVSRPEDCNYEYCKSRGWNYDAMKQRELHSNLSNAISFPAQFYSNQQAVLGWEVSTAAPGGIPACKNINYAMLHYHFEWQQRFETKIYDHVKLRQCRR